LRLGIRESSLCLPKCVYMQEQMYGIAGGKQMNSVACMLMETDL